MFLRAAPPSGAVADGPFAGVPTVIKDAADVAGLPTWHGRDALAHVYRLRRTEFEATTNTRGPSS